MKMDCYGCRNHDNRLTMHVQGLSHWAPANIGPYSQAVKVREQLGFFYQVCSIFSVSKNMIRKCKKKRNEQ